MHETYFADAALAPTDLAAFFSGARAFWDAQPWTLLDDESVLLVQVPALGIEAGCVSIVGSMGAVRGFALFSSFEAYSDDEHDLGDRALYVTFADAAFVAPAMRTEAAAHGWLLPNAAVYPTALRVARGEPSPARAHELRCATAVMVALSSLTRSHPELLTNYGDETRRISLSDCAGCEVAVTVPHPDADLEADSAPPQRAQTLSGDNPYALPLDAQKREELTGALGSFAIHGVIGLFCAAASVPKNAGPEEWLSELIRNVEFANEARFRKTVDLLMVVHKHVVAVLERDGIDALVPEADDAAACRQWAHGYAALLVRVDAEHRTGAVIDGAFAIQVLAGVPQMLALFDKQRGRTSREDLLDELREGLAEDASTLFETWAEARSQPPEPTAEPIRASPKVGRNDACPCGSGKKFKKCCARAGAP